MSTITIAQQKVAALRAHEILTEVYPARIADEKGATKDGAALHLAWLEAAIDTLDRLDRGEDMRPNLMTGAGALTG